ncbi:uncharacterized protein FTOL_13450 [Fusarium torulosum]|uniref:Uncharacterized protein n=1 Tax=Fusarium torulosum TaxID=33205 RepID=A0AAE8MMJ2_9HYPO|nr:uncharacterized protein FTOL_13450 [Fusarium torulosum]
MSSQGAQDADPVNGNSVRDRKANYALALHKACGVALKRVRNNNVVANTNWAAPLAAAPSAISTMAILLKAADLEAAAGLEVESQEVKTDDGTIAGYLPSKYFHTNLQHCSDVGRLAFLDAQHGMNTIRATAQSMIAVEGSIAYIIDLLEDPEDARYNLKPEIDAIKKTANKCLRSAEAITKKFEYWYMVILHLHQTSLSKKGEIVKEKEVTIHRRAGAAEDQKKYEDEKEVIKQKINEVMKKLEAAENAVDRAQGEVEWLRYAPVVPEISVLEEIQTIQRAIPKTKAAIPERGLLVGIKDAFVGQSSSHRLEDEAIRKAHDAETQRLRDAALDQAREQRKRQLQYAEDRLRIAREEEAKMIEALDDARDELNVSRYQLAEAKSNLEKAKGEFQMLNSKELELKGIMTILENSTRELATLKEKIEPVVEFFKSILGDIDHNVDENLQAFLRPIMNRIEEGTTAEEIEAITISRRSKEKIISTALQMQGRFSAIVDISKAYIAVSTDYIRPAINRMERLSTLTESEWAIHSQEFLRDCDMWMTEIDELASETNANVDKNMAKHMQALQMRAIEAAAEN